MDEQRARRVVDALRRQGVPAHLEQARAGISQFGVRVDLLDGRHGVWDTDGAAGLDAQVMRNGVLVGFVPTIAGSEDFTEEQVVAAIAGADYDQPVTRGSRPAHPHRATVKPGRPLPVEGGFLRRFRDGFR
jgi:hypothetical protein